MHGETKETPAWGKSPHAGVWVLADPNLRDGPSGEGLSE